MHESSTAIDVSAWPATDAEFEGRVPKVWVRDGTGTRWLFKQPSYTASGVRQGEDWAEWISCRVAAALGVPAADVGRRYVTRRKELSVGTSPPPAGT